MLKRIALMIVCLVCLGAGTALAEEKVLINGIDANYPPFAFVDQSGKPSGFDVDAIDWIATKMGFKVKHVPVDWDGIIPSLVAKKIDFISSGMTITPERAAQVNFTEPYWEVKNVFVTKKDAELKPEDIYGQELTVGMQAGTSEAKWMEDEKKKQGWKFEIRYYDSAPMAIEDVVNGRIDVAGMNYPPARDAEQKKPVKIIGTFGEVEPFGAAVRKEDAALLETLNKGFALLKADPYWEELIAKYLNK
ncbi:ABC transporter substrate-binding protein [Desulfovibrionales bacterium]